MKTKKCIFATFFVAFAAGSAWPGDRAGVFEAVQSVPGQWNDIFFSIDVTGASSDGEAVINQALNFEHEAALPGYVTYLRISSHGEMTLFRNSPSASAMGTDPYVVKDPLGTEQMVVLYSSAPLDPLFVSGANIRDLGSDRQSAQAFIRQLSAVESQGVKVASRRFTYLVSMPAGGTEYTTRSLKRQIDDGTHVNHGTGGSVAAAPSHVEFEFDSDRLTKQGQHDLDIFGENLVSNFKDRTVTLEGHTDALGSDDYNNSLSQRRAAAVKNYLSASFGISESKLTAVGKGKNNPIASNDSDADRSRNRRVDFIFFGPSSDSPH